jgi:hypothetical protein
MGAVGFIGVVNIATQKSQLGLRKEQNELVLVFPEIF